jgi:membrane associated rhomboid family serine protease
MEDINKERNRVIYSVLPGLAFVLLLWLMKLTEYVTDVSLVHFGINPRNLLGLTGIITSPFIHRDWAHLLHNTFPLIVLSAFVFHSYRKIAVELIGWLFVTAGLWTWCLGRPAYHIGASGLIYGLVSFLFFIGVLRRDRASLALSLLVALFYGSLIWGVLPFDYEVSWEAHLSGGLAGLMLAFYFRKAGQPVKTSSPATVGPGIDLDINANTDATPHVYTYKYVYKEIIKPK